MADLERAKTSAAQLTAATGDWTARLHLLATYDAALRALCDFARWQYNTHPTTTPPQPGWHTPITARKSP